MDNFLESPATILLGLGLLAFYLLRRLRDGLHKSGEWVPTSDGRMVRYSALQRRWIYRECTPDDESKIQSDRAW